MNYPYYIVQWTEGKLPCPPHLRCTRIRREFEKGNIGGRRMKEIRTEDPAEAQALWERDRFNRSVYIVERPNSPRRKVLRPYNLAKETTR
jgi:hypothetical protein